jgi:hypothetical protein
MMDMVVRSFDGTVGWWKAALVGGDAGDGERHDQVGQPGVSP